MATARDVNFPRNDPKISRRNHSVRKRIAATFTLCIERDAKHP